MLEQERRSPRGLRRFLFQTSWRDELKRAIRLAVEEGHFKADTDATQLAFEIYSLMLGLHHDAGLFGYHEARRRAELALQRLFASYQPASRQVRK